MVHFWFPLSSLRCSNVFGVLTVNGTLSEALIKFSITLKVCNKVNKPPLIYLHLFKNDFSIQCLVLGMYIVYDAHQHGRLYLKAVGRNCLHCLIVRTDWNRFSCVVCSFSLGYEHRREDKRHFEVLEKNPYPLEQAAVPFTPTTPKRARVAGEGTQARAEKDLHQRPEQLPGNSWHSLLTVLLIIPPYHLSISILSGLGVIPYWYRQIWDCEF